MAEGEIKAQAGLAKPLMIGAKNVVVGKAMARGKTAGLLMGQAEMAHGKGPLLRRQPLWSWPLLTSWMRWVCIQGESAAVSWTPPATALDCLANLSSRKSRMSRLPSAAVAPEACQAPLPALEDKPPHGQHGADGKPSARRSRYSPGCEGKVE